MKEKIFSQQSLIIFALLVSSLLFSCGKVTQVVKDKKEEPSFDISYFVSVYSTENIKEKKKIDPKFVADNYFSVLDDKVFAQTLGVKKDGGRNELSWGKALLIENKETLPTQKKTTQQGVTQNKRVQSIAQKAYQSKSYRKDGIELMMADYMWTKVFFDTKIASQWSVDSKKVKKGYPVYMLRFFSNKDKYFMKILDEKIVSGNKTIKANRISVYDTFISILFLMDIDQSKGSLLDSANYFDLTSLFDEAFFHSIDEYKLPENDVKKFKPTSPVFIFNGKFEKELLKLMKLVRARDFEESEKYIKDRLKSLLSKKETRKILINNINTFKKKL